MAPQVERGGRAGAADGPGCGRTLGDFLTWQNPWVFFHGKTWENDGKPMEKTEIHQNLMVF